VWKDFLGLNAQFLWFSTAQVTQQIAMLKALGLEWVRVDLHWDTLEPAEGQYNFQPLDSVVATLLGNQISSLFYVVGSAPFASSAPPLASNSSAYPPSDPNIFAGFMGALAQRYPTVDAWQVWNEPNLASFWMPQPNVAAYAALLQSSVDALRQTAPQVPIAMAGMAYYSQIAGQSGLMLADLAQMGVFGLGAIAAYHPYTSAPEGDVPQANDFVTDAQQLNQQLRAAQAAGIWATEWGWSSYAGPEEEQPIIGESGQADYVLRRLALMSALDYDKIFLFTLSDLDDRATVRDRSYGLLDIHGNPKPVYTALANFLNITGPELLPEGPPNITQNASGQYSIAWRKPDGTHLWMFWALQPGPIELAGISSATLYQPLTGTQQSVVANDSVMGLQATSQLQILEWQ
jgi:beta-xylosidase